MIRALTHSLPLQRPSRVPLFQRLATLHTLYRQRRQLARLEPHLLCDIGVTRDAAEIEAARPVWDAPEKWLVGNR
ncbi:DUF1127 domain-containing protein [Mesobacterium sp. TK19101]|uniref:DUF1127 domain-containing protein n=1 Tax=Mesobacterium hydrothermale TaxID=3111907 RepID=A0ABU6HFU1_9RHOB|nr:DUF1127 domain-containing protein [Mesobacterium sp. TK19101]MEC3859970.1 DUF1127 domain-containing protein [Mesobacterium sp. TK19101]